MVDGEARVKLASELKMHRHELMDMPLDEILIQIKKDNAERFASKCAALGLDVEDTGERAAAFEHGDGMPRREAETAALIHCLEQKGVDMDETHRKAFGSKTFHDELVDMGRKITERQNSKTPINGL